MKNKLSKKIRIGLRLLPRAVLDTMLLPFPCIDKYWDLKHKFVEFNKFATIVPFFIGLFVLHQSDLSKETLGDIFRHVCYISVLICGTSLIIFDTYILFKIWYPLFKKELEKEEKI